MQGSLQRPPLERGRTLPPRGFRTDPIQATTLAGHLRGRGPASSARIPWFTALEETWRHSYEATAEPLFAQARRRFYYFFFDTFQCGLASEASVKERLQCLYVYSARRSYYTAVYAVGARPLKHLSASAL